MNMYLNSNFADDLHASRVILLSEGLFNSGAYFFSREENDSTQGKFF